MAPHFKTMSIAPPRFAVRRVAAPHSGVEQPLGIYRPQVVLRPRTQAFCDVSTVSAPSASIYNSSSPALSPELVSEALSIWNRQPRVHRQESVDPLGDIISRFGDDAGDDGDEHDVDTSLVKFVSSERASSLLGGGGGLGGFDVFDVSDEDREDELASTTTAKSAAAAAKAAAERAQLADMSDTQIAFRALRRDFIRHQRLLHAGNALATPNQRPPQKQQQPQQQPQEQQQQPQPQQQQPEHQRPPYLPPVVLVNQIYALVLPSTPDAQQQQHLNAGVGVSAALDRTEVDRELNRMWRRGTLRMFKMLSTGKVNLK